MKHSYPWTHLNRLAAGGSGFVRLRYGEVYWLDPTVTDLPMPLREQLVLDGFDLSRQLVVRRDPGMFDGFAFEQ
jgi:hypothetical protein